MNQGRAFPIDVAALRAKEYSPDGKNVIISLRQRFSAEQIFSVPLECLYELITDLQKLNAAKGASAAGPAAEPAAEPAAKPAAEPAAKPQPASDPNQVTVTVPKKWQLRSGLPAHPLVIVILDPQTEAQTGYALTPPAAQEMAVALTKIADTVAKHEAKKRTLS